MQNNLKNILFYTYNKCSTCRKASNWLEQNNFEFKLIDIVKEPPSKNLLELALVKFLPEKKRYLIQEAKVLS